MLGESCIACTRAIAVGKASELRPELNRVCILFVKQKDDDEARSCIVRAAEMGVINSSDILPTFREFKSPSHEEFRDPTRWSLMNALSEIVKKYTPQRVDFSYRALNRAFGLDGRPAALFAA